MARTSMKDLHNILFEAMERTLNPEPESPLSVEQAHTIVKIAETVISAGRAEVEYVKAMGAMNPGGMPPGQEVQPALFLLKGSGT